MPALSLTTLAAVALLIPALAGMVLGAPILVMWRWWRFRDRSSGAAEPAGSGDGQVGTSWGRSAAALAFPQSSLISLLRLAHELERCAGDGGA